MSEENAEDVVEEGAEVEAEVVEAVVEPVATYAERQEATARKGGWKPEEEWVAGGGDIDKWTSAEGFNIRGEFIGEIKNKNEQIAGFNKRLDNVNALHDAQLEVQRTELEGKKTAAIEAADPQAVAAIDKQLDAIAAPAPQAAPVAPELDAWNTANPWILEDGAKSAYAKSLYGQGVAQGLPISHILAHVNQAIDKEFPSKPANTQPAAEGGSKPSGRQAPSKTITMSDVTPADLKARAAMANVWPDTPEGDKAFLKAVSDSRKEK